MRKPPLFIRFFLLAALIPMLTGAGMLQAELNIDKPLVDLDLLIKEGETFLLIDEAGDDSEQNEDTEHPDEPDSTLSDNSVSPAAPAVPAEPEEIKIRVNMRSCFVNGRICPENAFRERFMNLYKDGMPVMLTDDYAEYHTYKRIKEFLQDNSVKYSEEMSR